MDIRKFFYIFASNLNINAMIIVKCPKCKCDTEINIAKAVDENGEVFSCGCCGFQFRYTEK